MDNEKMGRFIAEARKEKQLTQKELAALLDVTDKAVSKWERGLSFPDISLLSKLSEILGVTAGELLNGEKTGSPAPETEAIIQTTLQYADTAAKNKKNAVLKFAGLILTCLSLLGIVTCVICNAAISGELTWSLYPVSAILYAWLLSMPLIVWRRKGILISLIVLSVLTIPFLFVLEKISGVAGGTVLPILPIGGKTAAVGLVYLWVIYLLFAMIKKHRFIAAGIAVLFAAPVTGLINRIVDLELKGRAVFDHWDLVNYCIIFFIAAAVVYAGYFLKNKKRSGGGKE